MLSEHVFNTSRLGVSAQISIVLFISIIRPKPLSNW